MSGFEVDCQDSKTTGVVHAAEYVGPNDFGQEIYVARLDDRRREQYLAAYTERFGRTPHTAPEYVPTRTRTA